MKQKNIIAALLFFIIISLPVLSQSDKVKDTLYIPDGKVGLVGFGSLMSKSSFENTLNYNYNGKIYNIHLKGFERIWNHGVPNDTSYIKYPRYLIQNQDTIFPSYYVYLNIREKENQDINARLYIIDTIDLKKFDKREFHHTKIKANDLIQEFHITNGNVFVYQALPDHIISTSDNIKDNVILKSYVDLVEKDVLNSQGENFKKEYFKSTTPFPQNIVIEDSDLRSSYKPVYKEISVAEHILKKYVGTYEMENDSKLTIILKNGNLFLEINKNFKIELFAESSNKFFMKDSDFQIEFIENPEGSYNIINVYGDGIRDRGKRRGKN